MRALAFSLSLFGLLTFSTVARAHPRPRPSGPPELLFTFDDGPAVGKTPKILDALQAHHIHAVFFVNGRHLLGSTKVADESRALLREEIARGNAVGNHTIHHYFLCGHAYSKLAPEEIEGNAALIQQATGMRPDLFRTPYGSHCRSIKALLASLGIHPIGWDIDPQDWRLRNPAKIEAYVESHLRHLQGRNILLMHDIQGATVVALPRILDWIDQENAARIKSGRVPIKIIDYSYLLPRHELVPPLLDALGRVLIRAAARAADGPIWLWPQVAWLMGQV
ncbi:MAG TPA: polysaccharide deacetylase family protein [Polyangia bacterium]